MAMNIFKSFVSLLPDGFSIQFVPVYIPTTDNKGGI